MPGYANLGRSNGKWNGGVYVTPKGYRRISHGPNRNQLEHRLVMQQMLMDPIGLCHLPVGDPIIPTWATVHHIDHQKRHNCPDNLMLLDYRIHNALSRSYRKYILDHYAEFLTWQAEQDRWE